MKPSKRTAKKRPRNTASKVLSSGEVTKGNIHPDDVEETMLAVCDGVLKLVRLAFGNTSEIIRHKAGGALVDILKRWFLAEWNTQSDNSHLNVNLLELMKRNDGFKKRHGELYSRTGKKDALGSAVRRFTSELWLEMMMQESMAASVTLLGQALPQEVNGQTVQPKPMPLFDKWALSVNAYGGLPDRPTTLDIEVAIQFARLEHFESYWRDVFSKAAKDRHEEWWGLTSESPSKEDAAILKQPFRNSTRFKALQAARDNPPAWIEIVKQPWRNKVDDRVKKALHALIAPHGAARRVVASKLRRK